MLDHIEIYDNVIPSEFCNILINLYGKHQNQIQHFPGWMDQIGMCDKNPKFPGMPKPYNWSAESAQLNALVDPCIDAYKIKYDLLDVLPKKLDQESYRIKRYRKNEQEFRLHSDCSTLTNSSRFLAVLIYLNNSDAGTEFPLQQKMVDAVQGRVVVFPPMWLWPHRGLRPITGDKYIISTYHCYAA
jgi:prolyl 4-hydroxylase